MDSPKSIYNKGVADTLNKLSTYCFDNRLFLSAKYEVVSDKKYDFGKPHFFLREKELRKWIENEEEEIKMDKESTKNQVKLVDKPIKRINIDNKETIKEAKKGTDKALKELTNDFENLVKESKFVSVVGVFLKEEDEGKIVCLSSAIGGVSLPQKLAIAYKLREIANNLSCMMVREEIREFVENE